MALPSPSWPRFHVRAVPFVRTNEISSPRGGEPGFGRRSCSSLRLKRAIHLRHRRVPIEPEARHGMYWLSPSRP